MDAIGPGDFVECVDVSDYPGEVECGALKLGEIYRVHDVLPATIWSGEYDTDGLELVEFPQIDECGYRWAFDVRRFRPIYRPKRSLIEQLKQPVREPAA